MIFFSCEYAGAISKRGAPAPIGLHSSVIYVTASLKKTPLFLLPWYIVH
jgi:hypothetical protein